MSEPRILGPTDRATIRKELGGQCLDPELPQDAAEDNFHGHENRECGEHRTVGSHRAWCFECHEWCSPAGACKGCELPYLRAEVDRLTADLAHTTRQRDGLRSYVQKLYDRDLVAPVAVALSGDENDALSWLHEARAAQPQEGT